MSTLKRALYEDVFAVFERACQEGEFELADHTSLYWKRLLASKRMISNSTMHICCWPISEHRKPMDVLGVREEAVLH